MTGENGKEAHAMKHPLNGHIVPEILMMVALASVAAAADTPTPRSRPTFSSGLEVVNLNLTATDVQERFVTDLTEQEITIFEDGVPQRVSLFSRERLPLSLAVLLDCSASMEPRLAAAREAARRLLRTLLTSDEALVACFNQNHRVLQDYTRDPHALEDALGRLKADGTTGLYSALYVTLRDLAKRGGAAEARRRAVVVLSDGEDTSSLVTDDQVLDVARRSGVAIYTISFRQTVPGLVLDRSRAPFFMGAIARETGGRAYSPAALPDLEGVYGRIAEELRTQYGVGYVSTNPERNGKWRRIAIHSRRDSLLLRHRAGYYAPHPSSQMRHHRDHAGMSATADSSKRSHP